MRKVIPMPDYLQGTVLPALRAAFYGKAATPQEYKDSFVINEAVERFGEEAVVLLDDRITGLESQEKTVSKTVNLRSTCYVVLANLANDLSITPAEACRRLLYYSYLNVNDENTEITNNTANAAQSKALSGANELSFLKAKVLELVEHINALEKEISAAKEIVAAVTAEISRLEERR